MKCEEITQSKVKNDVEVGADEATEEGVGLCHRASKPWFSNWTMKRKIDALDNFHCNGKKEPTLRWAARKHGKRLHNSTLSRWIKHETSICDSYLGDRHMICDEASLSRKGYCPEMEVLLTVHIRSMRQSGTRVTSWMVVEDAKEFLTKLHPTADAFKFVKG